MIELVWLLLATLVRALRSHQRLLLENLLLRQQLQVALRGQRRPRLRAGDKLFWLLVRHAHRNWRRHLLLVRPETVLRWLWGAARRSAVDQGERPSLGMMPVMLLALLYGFLRLLLDLFLVRCCSEAGLQSEVPTPPSASRPPAPSPASTLAAR